MIMELSFSLIEQANQLGGTNIKNSQLKAFNAETPFPSLFVSPDDISIFLNPNKCTLLKRKDHKIVRDLAAIFKLAERLRPFIDKEYCFSVCNRDKNLTGFPSLSQSRLLDNHADLLIPDFYFILSEGYLKDLQPLQLPIDAPSMQQRIANRSKMLYWRGSKNASSLDGYVSRLNFIKELNAIDGIESISSCRFTTIADQTMQSIDKSEAKAIQDDLGLVPAEPFLMQAKYLLHLDVDGHSSSFPGLYRKLALGGCVLKVKSPYIQWYYHMLKNEINYILISSTDDLIVKLNYLLDNWSTAVQIGIRAAILARSISIESSLDQVSQELDTWDSNFNPLSLRKFNPKPLA